MGTLLVIGTASHDTLHLATGIAHTVGGAGLYTALASAEAGATTSLFAPKPDPMPAVFAPVNARVRWLGPRVAPEAMPQLEIAHHGGGRATLLGAGWGAEAVLLPEQLPDDLSIYDCVHIAALSSAARQLAFLEACRARGARRISVGTYARVVQAEATTVRALLAQADIFYMNENEARLLFGTVEQAATRAGALLFVTLGEHGALAISSAHRGSVPGNGAIEIDPTGAGDTFCGAALAALTDGADMMAAAMQGCAQAARIIEHPGPFPANTMTKPSIEAWAVVSSKILLDHPRLTIAEDIVALPDGKRINWLHFPHAGDFVVIIAINASGEFLVSYQYNHPPQRVVDEFPGGAIDGGEDMLQAAKRELLEETGWHAGHVEHIGSFLANNRRSKGRGHVVVARQLTPGADAPEAGEIIVTRWLSAAEINAAIVNGEIENVTLLAAWAMWGANRDQRTQNPE